MADTGKRKISAKEMVADIRSGMDEAQLQRKYGLSREALGLVLHKLVKASALNESEIRNRGASAPGEKPQPQGQRPTQGTLCPSCNALVPGGLDECPMCGVVLSKFHASHALATPTLVKPPDVAGADSQGVNRWLSIVLSVVVLSVIGISLVIWAMHRDKQKFEAIAVDSPKALEEIGSTGGTSEEDFSDETSIESNPDDGSETADPAKPGVGAEQVEPAESKKQTAHSRQPDQALQEPPSAKATYITGQVRRFTSGDFKKEVVEASKTYPVMFQFYSDT